MKKISTLLATAVVAMAAAFSADAQVSVGVGYNLESITLKQKSSSAVVKEDPTVLNGFYVNASYNWDFLHAKWGVLSLQPGLTYSFAGTELEDEEFNLFDTELSAKVSMYEHYLDVPVNVRYAYEVVPSLKVYATAGPVFSFGLASNQVVKSQVGDLQTVTKTNLYTGKSSVKSSDGSKPGSKVDTGYGMFDLKLGIGLGVILNDAYELKLGYDFGLLNKVAGMNDAQSAVKLVSHVNYFRVGFAYNF